MTATFILSTVFGFACARVAIARRSARREAQRLDVILREHNARRFWTLRLDRGPLLGAPVVFIVEADDEARARLLASMQATESGPIVRRCAGAFLDPARTSCRSHGPLIRLRVA